MQKSTLRLGAWAGILSFAFTFVTFPLALGVNPESPLIWKVLAALAGVIDTIVTVVFLSILGGLLARRFNIQNMITLFWLLIAATILLTVGSAIATFVELTEIIGTIMAFVGIVSYGIVFLLIGLGLMRWKGDLYGMRQAMGVTALVSGILLLTVFGGFLAIIGILAWTVMAVVVLFRAAKDTSGTAAQDQTA